MTEMDNQFFEKPILNSPYDYPLRHWELDAAGRPTQQIIETRRRADFITPIPKPKKRKGSADQKALLFDDLATQEQRYDHTAVINSVRQQVDQWRKFPNTNDWRVTPETARLLQNWRHHKFGDVRPFFCQIEAVETAICLTEVAPQTGKVGDEFLDYLKNTNNEATYRVPGVSNLGTHGRWAFSEFTEVYQIESDFEAKVRSEFEKMIDQFAVAVAQ